MGEVLVDLGYGGQRPVIHAVHDTSAPKGCIPELAPSRRLFL
jgi:hypothetical protein